MIYTSYYGRKNLRLLSDQRGLTLLQVSKGVCRGFEDIARSDEVIPSWSIIQTVKERGDYAEYKQRYWHEILQFVDVKEWTRKHDNSILLCFERNIMQCHRYLLSKWIIWGCGNGVYGGEL